MRRMIPLLACFGILLTTTPSLLADEWGHLTGQIIYDGPRPTPAELKVTKDVDFCGKYELVDQSLVVGEGGGLQNAFVFLYLSRRAKKPAIHPSYEATANAKVVLDNSECRFVPHALAIRTSQILVVKNSDTIGHNAKIESFNNERNPNIPANSEMEIKLDAADKLPAIVSCGSHPWMGARLLIRDEPYFAITDNQGRFRIENLPAGKWTFQFWHERSGYLREMTRDGKKILGRRGEIEIEIKDGQTTDLGVLKIGAKALEKK